MLASQRIGGEQPELDRQGQPVKWDRVYRVTRGQKKRPPKARHDAPDSAACKKALNSGAQPLPPPIDQDSLVVSHVVDIWRHSTVQFASRDPLTSSYHTDYSMYNRLMQSMAFITLCSSLQWPKHEIDMVCAAIPALVAEQPAMVCDLLNFLTTWEPPESFKGFKFLRDHLFAYIRNMSRRILPEASSLRLLTAQLYDRETFTRLGASIAKAKIDTMWNTTVGDAGYPQHDRPFFRQVLINAILVVMDYGELEFASTFLARLAKYDAKEPYYVAACVRLSERQGNLEEVVSRRDEVLPRTETPNIKSNPSMLS